jgi:hypothetical protein
MSLEQLLSEGRRFGPEYADGLSNHRPMALLALHRLGADDARLASWAAGYEQRHALPAAPPQQPWPPGDPWPDRRGDIAAWPAYRSLFAEWIEHEGATGLLQQILPSLLPGCSAAAFHGPIRVAAAVRSGHLGELADALAYWACRWQALGPLPAGDGPEADPAALLRRVPAGRSTRPLIMLRMLDAARAPGVQAAIAQLRVDAALPERLARLSAEAYAASGNFTALHLVTGCHALRVLLRFVDDDDRLPALRAVWQAWAVAVVAARLKPAPAVPLRPWPELEAGARASEDEHVIKLVEACREEESAYGGDAWQRAASRALAA